MKRKPNRYQYTLRDLQEMVKQLGGRLRVEIYPAELDAPASPQPDPVEDVERLGTR